MRELATLAPVLRDGRRNRQPIAVRVVSVLIRSCTDRLVQYLTWLSRCVKKECYKQMSDLDSTEMLEEQEELLDFEEDEDADYAEDREDADEGSDAMNEQSESQEVAKPTMSTLKAEDSL